MTTDIRWSMLSFCPLPDFVDRVLKSAFDVTPAGTSATAALLGEQSAGHQVVLTSVGTPLAAAEVAALAPSVRAIATYSVGLNHIDLAAARARQIAVFNTPDVLTDSVADVAMLHVLAALRRVTESIDLLRSRNWSGWTPFQILGRETAGRQLGIYGMGRIGRAIATRARAFGMTIHYCNRRRLDAALEDCAIFHEQANDMLAVVDVLLLAAPLGSETAGFLDRARIAQLRPGAVVINIARGELVDDGALIAALRSGHVGAAGLDVFSGEPKLNEQYFELPNVFMTPHIGSSTIEARRRMAEILVQGIERWRRGERPPNLLA
jgi:lactate dehydrogenase-like 2-hydroxyacid dehydrogenase